MKSQSDILELPEANRNDIFVGYLKEECLFVFSFLLARTDWQN